MKKYTITVIILLALAALGYFGYRFIRARQQASTISNLQTVIAKRGDLTATVGATGTVRAEQTALLLWQTSGIVDKVNVQVGQVVTTGQTLASLSLSSLPQNIILAQSDLLSARDALAKLTNPDLSTISAAQKGLAAAYTAYQQAQNSLSNAIITNQNSNDVAVYNDWFNMKTALDAAQNNLPLANASIDTQAYYQAVRATSLLQDELDKAQNNTKAFPDDALLAQKVNDLEKAVQDSLTKQNNMQTSLPSASSDLVLTLSDSLSAYESASKGFIGTVLTDTLNTSVDLARLQADLAQKQSDLIDTQKTLDDAISHRQNMNGKRCDDATIADYQDAYDAALKAYNFSGHIANSREYQLLQTASANLNWCTSVWSEADIAAQDAKISSTQAQIQSQQHRVQYDEPMDD